MFPMALPQLTRLIIGRPAHDPKFQRELRAVSGNHFRRVPSIMRDDPVNVPHTMASEKSSLCAVAAVLLALAAGCSRSQAPKGAAPVPVLAAKAVGHQCAGAD